MNDMRPTGRKKHWIWPTLIVVWALSATLWAANEFKFPGDVLTTNAAGPIIRNTSTSSTNPSLVPHKGDISAGIGQPITGSGVALIGGGVDIMEARDGDVHLVDGNDLWFWNPGNAFRYELRSPALVSANYECTYEDDSSFIPYTCVGTGANPYNDGYATIKEEGSSLTQRSALNFIGSNVTCVDNAGQTECTITAGTSFSDSAGLRAILSDENGTGAALFDSATSPNFLTDVTVGGTSVCLEDGTNCQVASTTGTTLVPLRPATCQNTIPLIHWDLETANSPAPACATGSSTQKAYADFDQTTDECMQVTLPLPDDWTGDIDMYYAWLTTATSGSVAWCTQLICVANTETDDPSFPAQASGNCVSDTAHGTTNQMNFVTDTAITATGCAAGEELHVRLCRDPNETGGQTDTVAADARLADVMMKFRRSAL